MEAKQLIRRRGWRVSFRNVPRAYNAAADDMAQCARQLSGRGRLEIRPPELARSIQRKEIPVVDLM